MKRNYQSRVILYPILVILQAAVFFSFALFLDEGIIESGDLFVSFGAFTLLIALEWGFSASFYRTADKRARKNQLLGEFIAEVNRAILLNEDEKKVFSTVLDYAFRILDNVELGSILAFGKDGELVIVASRGFSEDFVRDFHIPLEETFQYNQSKGIISEAIIISPEIIRDFRHRLDSDTMEFKSIISVPLFIGEVLYGFLNIDSIHPNNFSNEDLALLKNFGSQIEVSLLAREQYRASLEKSRLDGLTGFLSRSYFSQIFEHSLDHAKRYEGKFVLGMFDVDKLKSTNDTFGHQAGDTVLKTIADAIRRSARKSDVVGRYGGDEFIGIYYNTDSKRMTEQANRILADLARTPLDFGNRQIVASFSFGFAEYPAEADSFDSLLAIADAWLYRMKAARKNGS